VRTPRAVRSLTKENADAYSRFDLIDGSHRFKSAAPGGCVEYAVRKRHGARVFYFNFGLAREMGLIPASHPDEMTSSLADRLIDTFSLVIINEWDLEHSTPCRKQDVRKNKYMATRYLQSQHPGRLGKTSGDGRGIWNGEIRHRGMTWDISSSGTGATCLSPAVAIEEKFFKTGDRNVGYGNGRNSLDEGVPQALMSEIFHRQGIETERTLAILSFDDGSSINVRTSHNLLRPAHFFCHLKQGSYGNLKAVTDFHIERERENGRFPQRVSNKYWYLAEQMARVFSASVARFESEYIFCWIDWDGDNILSSGGIIDYGSIRQFGLYHWQYRYDDVNKMSTTIPEQRIKARLIVQNFIQIADYLTTGSKKNIRCFKNHPLLRLFDDHFLKTISELLLKRMGFSADQSRYLITEHPKLVRRFRLDYSYFERAKASRGIYKVADGVTCDAIFSMREISKELPKRFLQNSRFPTPEEFIDIIKSSEVSRRDLRISPARRARVHHFQKAWIRLMEKVSEKFHRGQLKKTLLEAAMRSSLTNRSDRMTGDAAITLSLNLIRRRKELSFRQRYQIMRSLIEHQTLPDSARPEAQPDPDTKVGQIFRRHLRIIDDCKEGF
jgi:uncharacterized protein YdiU (UPF0061 family)